MYTVIAQAFGILGMLSAFISFQMKKNRDFFIFQTLCALFFSINFYMLEAYTGCLLNIFSILRGAVLAGGKKTHKLPLLLLIQICFIASFVYTYNGIFSILILIAQVGGTFVMWSDKGKLIRITQLFCISPLWLIYNIYFFTLGGILCESFNIISVIISFVRFGINGFENQKSTDMQNIAN